MSDTILFVDNSKLVLETAKDLFLTHGIKILTADNAMEAINKSGVYRFMVKP